MAKRAVSKMTSIQHDIAAKGREIFGRMNGETPRLFSHRNITGRLLDWSTRDEQLKVQLFRFVDVLPSLKSSAAIAEHACHYLLGNGAKGLPAVVRWAIRVSPRFPFIAAFAARQSVAQMARTFIVARNADEAVPALRKMRRQPLAFTADIPGETTVSEAEAAACHDRYLESIERLAEESKTWPPVEQIDCDDRGEIPKVNVSIKISALYAQIHPADPDRALMCLADRVHPLLRRAKELGVFINLDMESTALKDLTLDLFKTLLDEPALQDYPHAGIALQAYLRSSERDLDTLVQWAEQRNRRITVRLIKGACWDHERVMALQRGWPVPVFERKAETDANYERLARRMPECSRYIAPAFGTHSVRSIASCLVQAEKLGLPQSGIEIQMLHGMAEPIKQALVKMGYRVRNYCPIGEILPGMSYLVRRLLENTSSQGFLRATFSEHASLGELLRDPATTASRPLIAKNSQADHTLAKSGQEFTFANGLPRERPTSDTMHFANEPHTDFTVASNRERMAAALAAVRTQLGNKFPLVIGGKAVWTTEQIVSVNPARPSEVVGRVAKAGQSEAEAALAAARQTCVGWVSTSVDERARLLERTAGLIRAERFDIPALEVFETGKSWVESDADVAEAIDFCNFCAQEMRRIASHTYRVPGEINLQHYVPRGLGVVIAPWNFPLAILCGMTAASVVAGNCVIVKPSEQSSVIGARFMDLLVRAGLPPGVVNFLPGSGANIEAFLVEHPQIDFIAFTASGEVGLKIYEAAGRTRPGQRQLQKVVCEMGGKNAVIIDSDADLDEAIPGVIYSAFGYQEQKCSALSRLIVLRENYDRALDRLIEACRSLQIGPPEDPGTIVGPVIDQEAFERINRSIEIGKQEAELAFQASVRSGEGFLFLRRFSRMSHPRRASLRRKSSGRFSLC